MFRKIAVTLAASVALCSAAALVAGALRTNDQASIPTASTSHATIQLAAGVMHRSGYIVASS